jgi:hypothetical protein
MVYPTSGKSSGGFAATWCWNKFRLSRLSLRNAISNYASHINKHRLMRRSLEFAGLNQRAVIRQHAVGTCEQALASATSDFKTPFPLRGR